MTNRKPGREPGHVNTGDVVIAKITLLILTAITNPKKLDWVYFKGVDNLVTNNLEVNMQWCDQQIN